MTFYPPGHNIQTNVQYERVIAMGRVLYLKFLGARAIQEAKNNGLRSGKPLVVLDRDLVIDCDDKAWACGVRPGDTLRQAMISSPACRVLKVSGPGGESLGDILDILAKVSPYVEPAADQSGVFVDIPLDADPAEILDSLDGLYSKVFAGVSSSKLISRAACDLFMREYLERGKVSSGNTKWGFLRQENRRLSRSDRPQEEDQVSVRVMAVIDGGKERTFISGAPVDCLWMAPPEILSTLRSLGLKKVKDLREVSTSALVERTGDWAVLVKRWAAGEERSRVQALYPPPTLTKEVSFVEPVQLQKELFYGALKELAADLIEKGLGFKTIRLSMAGDFKTLSGNSSVERKFVRPVSSFEVMRVAVDSMLEGILKDISSSGPALSGFSVNLADIVPVQAKPSPLFNTEPVAKPKDIPVALRLALFGLEDKFGDGVVTWGEKDTGGERFNPEIMRREKMLSIWDPMRLQVSEQLPEPASVGGVADV